MLCEEDVIH